MALPPAYSIALPASLSGTALSDFPASAYYVSLVAIPTATPTVLISVPANTIRSTQSPPASLVVSGAPFTISSLISSTPIVIPLAPVSNTPAPSALFSSLLPSTYRPAPPTSTNPALLPPVSTTHSNSMQAFNTLAPSLLPSAPANVGGSYNVLSFPLVEGTQTIGFGIATIDLNKIPSSAMVNSSPVTLVTPTFPGSSKPAGSPAPPSSSDPAKSSTIASSPPTPLSSNSTPPPPQISTTIILAPIPPPALDSSTAAPPAISTISTIAPPPPSSSTLTTTTSSTPPSSSDTSTTTSSAPSSTTSTKTGAGAVNRAGGISTTLLIGVGMGVACIVNLGVQVGLAGVW